jgi:quercetin dioxygenase-like cupin family protein
MKQPAEIPYLIVRFADAAADEKLMRPGNNGRKVLVNALRPDTEVAAGDPLWRSETPLHRTPVVETGAGGVEAATFSQAARQDRHKHKRGTECYTVLAGAMHVRLNDGKPHTLRAGDELVVFPGTVHEILTKGEFLTRVHSIECRGARDKFVEKNGTWVNASRF